MKLVPYRQGTPPVTAVQSPAAFLHSLQEVREFAEIVLQSEMFKDVKSAAQAVVKIARGRELGLGPMESLSSLHVVEGKVTMSAQLMAALAQRSGFRYKVTELTDQICRLMWYDADGDELGPSEFTMHDAHRAGLARRQNWRKYPKAMLQARALAAGARLYAAAALLGVYDPDELAQDDGHHMPPPHVMQAQPPQGPGGQGEIIEGAVFEQSASEGQAPAEVEYRHPSEPWHQANRRIREIALAKRFHVDEIRLIIRHVFDADSSTALSNKELNGIADALEEGHNERHEAWLAFAIQIMQKADYSEDIVKQAYADARAKIWHLLLLHRHLQARQG